MERDHRLQRTGEGEMVSVQHSNIGQRARMAGANALLLLLTLAVPPRPRMRCSIFRKIWGRLTITFERDCTLGSPIESCAGINDTADSLIKRFPCHRWWLSSCAELMNERVLGFNKYT